MGFLSNKHINFLNIHSGLFEAAEQIKIYFGAIFFLKMGIPVYGVALLWALYFVSRIIWRLGTVHLLTRFGVKQMVIIGALLTASTYIFLSQIHTWSWAIPLYFITISFIDSFYWTGFHVLYSLSGDKEHRGKQVAIKQVLFLIADAGIPIVSGVIASFFGFFWVFILALVLAILSVFPLFFIESQNFQSKHSITYIKEIPKWNIIFQFNSALYQYGYVFIWMILVYFLMGENTQNFGFVVGISVALQMCLQFFVGHMVDNGHGKWMIHVGGTSSLVQIVAQMFFVQGGFGIVASNLVGTLKKLFFDSASGAAFYNFPKHVAHPVSSLAFAESGFDLGAICVLLLIAGLDFLHVPLKLLLALGMIGVLLNWLALKHYYSTHKIQTDL